MTDVIREYRQDSIIYRELLVPRSELGDYCNPITLDEWDERVFSIDYNDDDTFTIIVEA